MSILIQDDIINIAGLDLQNSNLWELTDERNPSIKYRVKSVSLPFLSLETITRKTGTKHYSEYVPEGEFDISFYETTNWITYTYLNNWLEEVFDKKRRVFNAGVGVGLHNLILSFQMDDIQIINNIPIGERKYNKVFKFERTKIKKIQPLDLNYEGTNPIIITATFIADRIIELPLPTSTTQATNNTTSFTV